MNPKTLGLFGMNLRPEVIAQLEALPCFAGVSTERLCQNAQGKIRGGRKIECRITAMLIIVGTKPLTDEVFQIPPTARELEIGG